MRVLRAVGAGALEALARRAGVPLGRRPSSPTGQPPSVAQSAPFQPFLQWHTPCLHVRAERAIRAAPRAEAIWRPRRRAPPGSSPDQPAWHTPSPVPAGRTAATPRRAARAPGARSPARCRRRAGRRGRRRARRAAASSSSTRSRRPRAVDASHRRHGTRRGCCSRTGVHSRCLPHEACVAHASPSCTCRARTRALLGVAAPPHPAAVAAAPRHAAVVAVGRAVAGGDDHWVESAAPGAVRRRERERSAKGRNHSAQLPNADRPNWRPQEEVAFRSRRCAIRHKSTCCSPPLASGPACRVRLSPSATPPEAEARGCSRARAGGAAALLYMPVLVGGSGGGGLRPCSAAATTRTTPPTTRSATRARSRGCHRRRRRLRDAAAARRAVRRRRRQEGRHVVPSGAVHGARPLGHPRALQGRRRGDGAAAAAAAAGARSLPVGDGRGAMHGAALLVPRSTR